MAAGDEYHSGTFYLDYRMLHKDGHVVWIRDSSVLVRAPDGTLLWHGIMLDITDQKLIEQQLERQSGAQAAVAQLGELALGGMPITELLQEACRMTTKVLGVDAAAASQVGEDGQSLDVRADYGWPAPKRGPTHHGIDPRGPGAQSLMTGKPLLIQDLDAQTESSPSALLIVSRDQEHHLRAHRGPAAPLGRFRRLLPEDQRLQRARRQLRGGGRQHPCRRDRAPGRRGRDGAPRAARRPHRPAEPQPFHRPPRAVARARPPAPGLARRDPVHRRGSLQAGQRLARAPGRRRAAEKRRHPPA